MRTERENCCDDVVVAAQGDARGYAAALVTLEERRRVGCEAALAATGGNLTHRIRRLLNQPEEPPAAAGLMASMGLMLGLVVLVAAAQQPNQNKPTPYQLWLNDDVAYIIRDEERAAFRRLQTDEERQHFIGQFWLRRDPTPGTSLNEFKEEHYRRIAYSNERYAAKGIAGWKTDRGRTLIVSGPPDEIESHHAAGRESWLYKHLEGIGANVMFEFVDPKHTGEYRLKGSPSVRGRAK